MTELSFLHYIDYTCQGDDGPQSIEEVARHVHAFNRDNGNSLGYDFPAWVVGGKLTDARHIRLFGDKDALSRFIRQPRSARLLGMGDVARSAITPVPVGAPLAAVVRDAAAGKAKPSHARRREARGVPAYTSRKPQAQFSISFSSKSTGQDFLLKLKKKAVEVGGMPEFNSYGACRAGGVPQF